MFNFKNYHYDPASKTAVFTYQNDQDIQFTESIVFENVREDYDEATLEQALKLAFLLIGTSYYKAQPTTEVSLGVTTIDAWQTNFLNSVYQEGLSQFAFENSLHRSDLAHFKSTEEQAPAVQGQVSDSRPVVLQSGGKDSLLLATLLEQKQQEYTPWFLKTSDTYPEVLSTLEYPLTSAKRLLDRTGLIEAASRGGLNGHVPVTYIVLSIALIQAVLLGKNTVLSAVGTEGEEPHGYVDDLPVMHQWAKTWAAEQQFAQYVQRYISPEFRVGSPLRALSELKIAELFVKNCWQKFSSSFSSCNVGNYIQGQDNQKLGWCGECPKCANSFLLFAPFADPEELKAVFNGQNLFEKPSLAETFKGLLGVDGVMKPLECVGEIDELRLAYHMAQKAYGDATYKLNFAVPASNFDYNKRNVSQEWASNYL